MIVINNINELKNKIFNEDCISKDLNKGMNRIPDKSIDMILCDLPYGTTQCKWDNIIELETLWMQYNRIVKQKGIICLFADEPFTSKLIISNIKNFKYRITWDKMQGGGFLNSKKMPLKQTEDICIFSNVKLGHSLYKPQMKKKDKSKIRPIGNRKPCDKATYGELNGKLSNNYDNTMSYPTNIISISSKTAECNGINRIHPTQKPIELFKYLIKTYTNEGDIILDNCIGSGTTAIACLETGRNYIGFDNGRCDKKGDNQGKYWADVAKDRINTYLKDRNK